MTSESQQPVVLIVEDEPSLAGLYAEFLEDRFAVRTATSGAEGVGRVDQQVSVVICDRRMPEMSGDEVVGAIRTRGFECRVGMLTAIEPGPEILTLPIDAYLTKPVTRAELVDAVETLHRRGEFGDQCRQLSRLASKQAALENADMTHLEEYETLTTRYRQLASEIDSRADRLEPTTVFEELAPSKT